MTTIVATALEHHPLFNARLDEENAEIARDVRLVVERDGGTVVGAQIVGPHASELVAEATLAVDMGATLEDLALTIHARPTLAEGLHEAAELGLGHPVHVPGRRPRDLAKR